ncbi:aromatic amino acid ammonia-lyase [Kutzneria viridogrisea]|uniref:Phenylalanine and histidine ammonia-lyase n=2 Tax=Kutzneria TaxID=43356 RepID=W5W5V7_9PSEU|nr:aromatic amino acid ammonia-lyase [Kutzneria albida]AHH93579.1 phenylalanine and histidine ammonia-lyase [Kutzneria albida DSM 43870]MBA8929036.1 histidine ammonia-lyase [Kutzneria viridogrisea]
MAVVLDGTALTGQDVVAIAVGRVPVSVDALARERVRQAAALAQDVSGQRQVYGRTTGVGANRVIGVDQQDVPAFGRRLLRSHAGGTGPLITEPEARAMMVIRANQLLAGHSGVSEHVVDALALALNAGCYPQVHSVGAIGTGDLTALAELALTLVGELPWAGPHPLPPIELATSDALAFLSSNALTIGQATLAQARISALLDQTCTTAALSLLAVDGSVEPFAEVVHQARPHRGSGQVAQRVRTLLGEIRHVPARVQDPFGLRCFPQVHGEAVDAVAALDEVLAVELNAGAENPLVSVVDGDVFHHGGFHSITLSLALDRARLAVLQTAQLSAGRLAMLCEPAYTGLRPFAADEPTGSSGLMVIEYTAAASLASVRSMAMPAVLGHATLSRGVEEHASFSAQSARMTGEVVPHYVIVLACELIAAVRVLRMRGLRPEGSQDLVAAFDNAVRTLPPETEDRPLTMDLITASALLTGEHTEVPDQLRRVADSPR